MKLKKNKDIVISSDILQEDYNNIIAKQDKLSLEKKYKLALIENAKLSKHIEIKNTILSQSKLKEIKKTKGNKKHIAIVAPFSDVHAGKIVDLETTFGLNEYNTVICDKRLNTYFNQLAMMVKQYQQNNIVDELIFAPIGDLIDGYIHDENIMLNELSDIEATIWIKDRLISGIEFLLKELDVKSIKIPFVVGNHDRDTEKKYFSKIIETSFGSIIADALIKHFDKNKRVNILFNKSNIVFVDVYNKTLKFEHGDTIKFGSGFDGISKSVLRAIAKDQTSKKYDLLVIGHMHTFIDGGKFIINSSIIGYDKYAIDNHLEYEEPSQIVFVIDDKGRRIETSKIYLT